MIVCNSIIFILENVGNLCEKVIENSIKNIKSVTDDCLSSMNDTNLEKMAPNKYDKIPVEEFDEEDIEIIWGDEWQEVV
mgnify:FL=1|jgi:hypothetical protein|uniref:Uncharacterized protein n=1 Tax=viral metagenome TaxID=1070528 RepID=A0A6C0IS10_9ZZZZ